MIKATVYFEKDINLSALVQTLKILPEPIRPVYFSEEEGKIFRANKLADEARFQAFIKENLIGFFLYAENKTCIDISSPTVGYASVTLYLAEGLSGELAVTLLRCLANYKPVFGYACEYDEYEHRNRYFITIGKNHVEDWVGRKLDKYISGIYWYTLLSDRLLTQHNVNLADLVVEAMTVEILGDGSLHLFKFFEKPEEWKEKAGCLDELCKRADGVFSKSAVEAAVAGVANFLEYDDVIAKWR